MRWKSKRWPKPATNASSGTCNRPPAGIDGTVHAVVRVQPDLDVRPVLRRSVVDREHVAVELQRLGRRLARARRDRAARRRRDAREQRRRETLACGTDYHSVVNPAARPTLRIATYNIHRCRGLDGRTRPDRIAAVLRAIDADVVALQEVVGAGPHGGGHAEELGAALGMGWVMAPARQLRGHQFGNAVLSRLPITQHLEHDLSWKTCEPRRMQRVDIVGRRLHAARLQRAPRHGDSRAAPPGAAARDDRLATATSADRSWCSAISTSGCAGWRRRCSARS